VVAGIAPGEMFPGALLLDLYRAGDAFTHGSGVDDPALPGTGQLEMDFPSDPDPETAFPASSRNCSMPISHPNGKPCVEPASRRAALQGRVTA